MVLEIQSEMFFSKDSFLLANSFTSSGLIVILLACFAKDSKSIELISKRERGGFCKKRGHVIYSVLLMCENVKFVKAEITSGDILISDSLLS